MEKPKFCLSIPSAPLSAEKHLSESSVHGVGVDAGLESRNESLGLGQAEQLITSKASAEGGFVESVPSTPAFVHTGIERQEPILGTATTPAVEAVEALVGDKIESCYLDKGLQELRNESVPGAIQDIADVPAPPPETVQSSVVEEPTPPGEIVQQNVVGAAQQDLSEQAAPFAPTILQDVTEQVAPVNETGSKVTEHSALFEQVESQNVAGQDIAFPEAGERSDAAIQNGSAAASEPELRRSTRPRKPSVRMRSPGGEAVERVSEPAVLKRRSALQKIPDNLQAVVPTNTEPLTPTKSLPSKMERMNFGNTSSHYLKANRKTSTKEKTCVTHYRQQGATPRIVSDTRLSQYACQKCSFRTTRMDNLVRHNKQDCAYVKDFFSWDANTFTEATQMPKKRSLSPVVACVNDVTEKASQSSSSRHKRPMRKFERSPRAMEKKKPAAASPRMHEESSEDDNDTSMSDATPQEKIEFAEDDVVWVEWKRLHWPALVLKVYPKTRKARVFLINSITAKETALVNIKKMFNFNNAERNKQFLNEGRVGHNSGALVKAAQKAEEFLRKRCLGSSIDAKRFFWNEEGDACSTDSDDFDLDPFCPAGDDDDGSDSVVARIKEKRKQCNEKLVQCIREGKVNDHLLGVLNGTVPSERNKLFYSTSRSENLQLKDWSWFGPIEDVSQQEEIYEFCFELLKANSDLGPTFDIASYVIEVWCPEAVMKALSLTRGINMDKAEEVLLRAVIHTRAECEANRQEFCSTLDPEADKESCERAHTELRDSGIADDIMAALL
uniref:PWWP domain-containing protein n=1 Tax=Hyalomma excavatum TaxID=257692 RepID=A0A131XIJ5_9ACAR